MGPFQCEGVVRCFAEEPFRNTWIDNTVPAVEQPAETPEELDETLNPDWGSDAPRGGRAVLTRILKESATVPLFFAQTLVQSLRDVGYNTTTSALCEHVDNAIEDGATTIRVYFRQAGRRGAYETDILVYDNGRGMPSSPLNCCCSPWRGRRA